MILKIAPNKKISNYESSRRNMSPLFLFYNLTLGKVFLSKMQRQML